MSDTLTPCWNLCHTRKVRCENGCVLAPIISWWMMERAQGVTSESLLASYRRGRHMETCRKMTKMAKTTADVSISWVSAQHEASSVLP